MIMKAILICPKCKTEKAVDIKTVDTYCKFCNNHYQASGNEKKYNQKSWYIPAGW